MIIKPKIRGFICTTTHPVGCEQNVRDQIAFTKSQGVVQNGPKKVLVIGASSGHVLLRPLVQARQQSACFLKSQVLRKKPVPQVGTTLQRSIKRQKKKACTPKALMAMLSLMKLVTL